MKNSMNITLGNINLVIEGQPVVLENIQLNYENEASVQELAAGASFIKDLVGEIKDMIKEAQASAQQYTPTPITSTTIKTTDENKVETPKTEQHWDLASVWNVMMAKKPEGFKKTGIGSYTFSSVVSEEKVKDKIKVQIEFNEDSIDMDIYTGSTAIHGYLYSEAKRSRITGINPALMDDMFEEMPDEIKEFVKNYFDRITK